MANNQTQTEEEQLKDLGKATKLLMQSGYISKKSLMWVSFLKGVASGFGAVIGATIVLALVLWALSLFSEVPFIGDIADSVSDTLDTSQ